MTNKKKKKEKYMSKDDAIRLVTKDTFVNLSERDAIYCYGMCKMTVTDEKNMSEKYNRLELVEFFEYIGRVADVKYKEQVDFNLGQKIELVLDDIFQLVNYKRNEKEFQAEEQSDSDDDY